MQTNQKIDTPHGLRLTHRLLQGYYRVPLDAALNVGPDSGEVQGAHFSHDRLFKLARTLETEVVAIGGQAVDYVRLRDSAAYTEFRTASQQLHNFDPGTLNELDQQLAFWVNLYNVLILDAVIQFEVHASVQEINGFFWKAAYSIGGQRYSAHDIEHGILRANRPHPAIPGAHFGPRDPRQAHSLAQLDPRIHFALNCASKSCPPISIYASDAIEDQLNLAAQSFINHGGVEVDIDKGEIRLSKIFQWYASDFGATFMALSSKQPLLDFVAPYLAVEDHRHFVLQDDPHVNFLPYDWHLNSLNGFSPE